MGDADGFTDAELRTKLNEYGFPLMPITGTTRKVMVKKLKLLMEAGKKPNDSGRRSLAQFSSEEESDTEVIKVVKKDKTRRATMAVPPMQPPVNNKVTNVRKSTRRNESGDDYIEPTKIPERKTRTTKMVEIVEKDFDTGSDSEPEIVETDYKSKNNYETARESPIKSTVSSSSTFTTSNNYTKKYTPPKSVDHVVSSRSYIGQSPSRYTTYVSPSLDASDKLNQIRSRLSLGGGQSLDTTFYSSTVDTPNSDSHTPFLSNFTKRLSTLSPNQKADGEVIKEMDTNGASSGGGSGGVFNRSYINRPRPREYTQNYQQQNQSAENRSSYVSFVLVGCVTLFFVVIIALYLGMHSGSTDIETSGISVPYCNKQDRNAKKGVNCISDVDIQGAVDIYKIIKPELYARAINHKCLDNKIKPYMTEDDIVSFISNNYVKQDDFTIRQDLNNFMIILHKNPKWEVNILQSATAVFNSKQIIKNLDTIYENKAQQFATAFAIVDPNLPIKCSLYLKIIIIAQTIVICVALGTFFWGIKYSYKYYNFYKQSKAEEVILMVEKIIEILQTNASEENFLVVNHVRDMILPIERRKQMEKTWVKALQFINENESRVRTEVQIVKGEQYEVWRWLGSLNTSAARNKSWQGQAFETQVGSPNSLPCSPTPCLKIRGMVEDGDRNLQTIREAVLVKCANQCRILHCAVDPNSKCVYLKCADQSEAAIAYRNLHGWWYAGHLVTVKYLRLERYMQRHPDSPQRGPPFLKAIDWSQ